MRSGSLHFASPDSAPQSIASRRTENPVLRPEDIHRLCRLARLEITSSEVADVSAKLSSIVAMVVTEVDRHELYQQNAPLVERDLYLVPKVIE
jgi:Asp-tRNA(Asn)/Glu-tRNA(Gln) amidotransferase C subunit